MTDAIVAAIAGVIGAIIGGLFARRKNDADAAAQITKAAGDAVEGLIGPLTERVQALEGQVVTLKRQLNRYARRVIYLMGVIDTLTRQIVRLGDQPEAVPDDWDPEGGEGET